MKKLTLELRIRLALVTVSVLFGTAYVCSKQVLHYVTPAAWSLIRAASTGILLSIYGLYKFNRSRFSARDLGLIVLMGAFGVALNQIAFFEGLARTTPTHSAVLNTSIPIFTLLFSVLLGNEKASNEKLAGIALSLFGVLVILEFEKLQFTSSTFIGDALTVMNSACFSFYLSMSRDLNRRVPPLLVTAGMFVAGSMLMLPYSTVPLLHLQWSALPWFIPLLMIYLVTAGTLAPYGLNNWALSKVESSTVAHYIYIQPVVAGWLSRLVFDERLTLRMLVGTLFVFAGVAVGTGLFSRMGVRRNL
jgi:drug/metabolite transporter (DMT)-like permease